MKLVFYLYSVDVFPHSTSSHLRLRLIWFIRSFGTLRITDALIYIPFFVCLLVPFVQLVSVSFNVPLMSW